MPLVGRLDKKSKRRRGLERIITGGTSSSEGEPSSFSFAIGIPRFPRGERSEGAINWRQGSLEVVEVDTRLPLSGDSAQSSSIAYSFPERKTSTASSGGKGGGRLASSPTGVDREKRAGKALRLWGPKKMNRVNAAKENNVVLGRNLSCE